MTTKAQFNELSRGSTSLGIILLLIWSGTQAANWWHDRQAATLMKQFAGPDSITLYTTTTCAYCAKARDWLSAHDVPWRECNIDTDEACARTFHAHGAPGTPLVQANGRWTLGFDQAWVAEALQMPSPTRVAAP
jgi:glutaredoxin